MPGVIQDFKPPAATPQKSPERAVRPPASGLVAICQDRYRAAAMWRGQGGSGPVSRSADSYMHEARRLYYGVLSPEQEALAADLAGIKINMVADRADIMASWLLDVVESNLDQLITVSPTPLPELSASAIEDVTRQIKEALVSRLKESGYPDLTPEAMAAMPPAVREQIALWLTETARSMKGAALAMQRSMAEQGAKDMQRLIYDQFVEAGFRQEFEAFIKDYSYMPYAVLKAPSVEMAMQPRWEGNKWLMKAQRQLAVRRVSPWDLYWSSDSTTPHNGSFVAEVIPTRKDVLMAMATSKIRGWIPDAARKAMEEFATRAPVDWLQRNPDSDNAKKVGWSEGQTLDRLEMHGLFSGRELAEYNIGAGIGRNEFVEAQVTLVGSHVVRARLPRVAMGGKRPYHVASFDQSKDHLCGRGLANLGADLQIAAYSAFWAMMRNGSFASGARGEVDLSRIRNNIKANATPEDVLNQQFHFVEPDMSRSAGGAAAFRWHNVPHYVSQYQLMLDDLGRRMDKRVGVPAIASGSLDFATAGRSHAGLSQLLGSAVKTMKAKLRIIDQNILEPVGEAFYRINMEDDKDGRFSGLDAAPKARGTSGLLERELRKSAAIEALQAAPALLQVAQMGGQTLPPGLVTDIVAAAAEGLGVDTSPYPELAQGGEIGRALDQQAVGQFGTTPAVPLQKGGLAPAT